MREQRDRQEHVMGGDFSCVFFVLFRDVMENVYFYFYI